MCRQASAGTATVKTLPHASRGPSNCGELVIKRAEKVNYRPRKITEAAAEWFAAPDC